MNWHNLSASQVAKKLESDTVYGLSQVKAHLRLRQDGLNKLTAHKRSNLFVRFLKQFANFMVITLLVAAAISFATAIYEGSDYVEPIIILLIVILNAVIGVIQENRAERALSELQKLSAPTATVIREGKKLKLPAENVVCGDLLELSTGNLVPADARLVSAVGLTTQESALTGESMPCKKYADKRLPESTALADRSNCVLSSTIIMSGHGTAIVTDTGMNTQVGKIAAMLRDEDAPQTPLQKRLAWVGRVLGIGAVLICLLIFILGILRRSPIMDSFMLSVSLAVAAIPEGLPAIVTVVLSIGVQRMAKKNAVVRHLPAVETLGGATVICSDKTGTLTQNVMTVTDLYAADGIVMLDSKKSKKLLLHATLCCNSTVSGTGIKRIVNGEPTENAIVLAASNAEIQTDKLNTENERLHELPFDSKRKLMTTVCRYNGGLRQITKGAPDVLLKRCVKAESGTVSTTLTEHRRKAILEQNERFARDALRVIAVAYRDIASVENMSEDNLTFLGLIGMSDPPRREALPSVATCKEAGIIPVMITGDHIATAKSIAEKLGIVDGKSTLMTGAELDRLSDEELKKRTESCRVFARVTPEHKVRIVKAFRSRGMTVAMTGDGVNDAPALKAADIGCAMGRSGTDVAKGAADIILTDDNFATIVNAVAQGRGIYDNIKKVIHFLLSCNIGEILTILVTAIVGMPTPLLPIHLLWVNLVTDALPAMALGVERLDRDIMKRAPIPREKSLFADGLGFNIIIEGLFMGALTLLTYVTGLYVLGGLEVARTMAFAVLSLSEIVHANNVRSERSLFKIGLFANRRMALATAICSAMQIVVIAVPSLASIFGTVPLNTEQWLAVFMFSLIPLAVFEAEKALKSRQIKREKNTVPRLKKFKTEA